MGARARWALIAVSAAAGVLLLATVTERLVHRGDVMPGVQVVGVAAAGRDVDAVRRDVAAEAATRESTVLTFTAADQPLTLDPAAVRMDVDELRLADDAARAGRGWHVDAVVGTVARLFRPDRVRPHVTWDDSALRRVVDDWVAQVAGEGSGGRLDLQGTQVLGVEAQVGTRLDWDAAYAAAVRALRTGRPPRSPLPVLTDAAVQDPTALAAAADSARALLAHPFTIVGPGLVVPIRTADVAATLVVRPNGNSLAVVVDPAKLGDVLGASLASLDVEPRNATLDVSSGAVRITPEQAGRRLDLKALAGALTAAGAVDADRVVNAPFSDVAPNVTADEIRRLGINEQVASFTTRHPAGEPRVRNIHRICDVVDGSIVQPGERFSLNSKAGKRTAAAGYVAAPVIEAGEFTDDIGGGVSQFTTTLYNALWLGGYEIDEHQPHSYWISRYPQGREATLSFPHPDLVFTNNWSTAVLIHCGYDATSITVTLFGDQEGRVVKAAGPEISKPVPAEDQVTDDPTLPEGTEKVLDEHTFDGFDVAWTRTVTAPGRAPASERFYTHYEPLGRKVARGTGPPESTTTATGPGGSTTTAPGGSTAPGGATTTTAPGGSSTTVLAATTTTAAGAPSTTG
jgi:vancomycin resistance protein YoaR